MWLLNKISCEIQILNEKVWKLMIENGELREENKKLMEFKLKQEEMMFLIWASIELAEPKTAWDAEKLQKGKELYEKLYKEELYYLKEENKKLKESLNITVQTKNEKIRNLLEELEYYKKQCGED